MSYVTYSADAAPPSVTEGVRSRRRSFWLIGLLIYAIACGVFLWWLQRPPPITPPLAIIPLPDGQQLRLLGSFQSREIQLRHSQDFEGRLRVDDYYSRGYGNTSWGSNSNVEKPWLIFSRFDPKMERFRLPLMDQIEVLEEGTGVILMTKILTGPTEYPVGIASFNALPRRSSELTLRFKHNGSTVNGKIPNPFFSKAAEFVAKPLPQLLEVDGITFELRGVKVVEDKSNNNARSSNYQLQPDLKVKAVAAPKAWLSTSLNFFDATGNDSGREMLPATDRVWGLRVTAHEGADFPFPPDQVMSLGKIQMPAPGKGVSLTIPPKLKEFGVVGIFALGKGNYALNYGTNGSSSLIHTSVSGSINKQTEIGNVPLSGFSGSINLNEFGVWMFLQTRGKTRLSGNIRVLHNGKAVPSFGSGSSSSGNREAREYSFGGSNTTPAVGEEIEFEFVHPKERKAEFYFERPKLPAEK